LSSRVQQCPSQFPPQRPGSQCSDRRGTFL
jgi:hypothetical protein